MGERVSFCNEIPLKTIIKDFMGTSLSPQSMMKCPFHNDANPSLKVFPNNRYKCFGCDSFGGPIDFIINLKYNGDKKKFLDVVDELCDKYNGPQRQSKIAIMDKTSYDRKVLYTKTLKEFSEKYNAELNKFKEKQNYFSKRGISKEIQVQYGLGFCKDKINPTLEKDGIAYPAIIQTMQNRWMIPIKDKYGFVIGFAARGKDGEDAKYINSTASDYFKKSEILYNYDVARRYDTIYVVEGYMDALTLIQCGYNNVVALMGCSMSGYQADLLRGKKVILCLDNDKAGQASTLSIIEMYKTLDVSVLCPLPKKDMNEVYMELGSDAVKELISNSQNAEDFVLDYIKDNFNLTERKDQETAWNTMASILGSFEESYRERYPVNTKISPIVFRTIWTKLYKLMEI